MIGVRRMTKDDLAAVAEIEREAFGSRAWSLNLFSEELQDKDKHYFVAEEEGTLIGYGGYAQVLDEGHIMNVAVDRSRRRKGAGKAILDALVSDAFGRGIAAMTLEVSEHNLAAKQLYVGAGFCFAGKRPGYYGKDDAAEIYWLTR